MEKEFVPYELALRMKKLKSIDKGFRHGFNEKTFAYFVEGFPNKKLVIQSKPKLYSYDYNGGGPELISAPTWQSAFRWFREKYELHSCIHSDYTWNISGGIWDLNEHKGSRYDWDYSNNYSTYEEAELSCLEKLIEIVESQTK
jgi:hypothetical protein